MGDLVRRSVPRTEYDRLVNHFGLRQANEMFRTYGNEAFNFLPARGQRFATANFSMMEAGANKTFHQVDGRNYEILSERLETTKYGQPLRGYLVGESLNQQQVKFIFKDRPPRLGMDIFPFGKVIGVDKLYHSHFGTFWLVWAGGPGKDARVLYVVRRKHRPEYAYVVSNQVDTTVDGIKDWLQTNFPLIIDRLKELFPGEFVPEPDPLPEPTFWEMLKHYWYVPVGLAGATVLVVAVATGGKKKETMLIPVQQKR
jgi:hypothetical protein